MSAEFKSKSEEVAAQILSMAEEYFESNPADLNELYKDLVEVNNEYSAMVVIRTLREKLAERVEEIVEKENLCAVCFCDTTEAVEKQYVGDRGSEKVYEQVVVALVCKSCDYWREV